MTGKQKLWGLLRHLLGDFGASRPWRTERAGGGDPGAMAPDLMSSSLWASGMGSGRVMEFTLLGASLRATETKVRLPSLPDGCGVGPESCHSSRGDSGGRLAQGTAGVCERRGPREMVQGDK